VEVGEIPEALLEVEAVADEELVGNDEADVADGKVVYQAAVRAVEQGDDGERARRAEGQSLHEVPERQAGVDDVLDDQDVAAFDLAVEVLQKSDRAVAPPRGAVVVGELEEVEAVGDLERPRQIGEEDDARLERGDEEWLMALVVCADLLAELGDPGLDVVRGEIDVADAGIGDQASSSP
jgi:hypothetical protein